MLTNMDILFSRVGEFTLIELKIKSHCFYAIKYWRNWWHILEGHMEERVKVLPGLKLLIALKHLLVE